MFATDFAAFDLLFAAQAASAPSAGNTSRSNGGITLSEFWTHPVSSCLSLSSGAQMLLRASTLFKNGVISAQEKGRIKDQVLQGDIAQVQQQYGIPAAFEAAPAFARLDRGGGRSTEAVLRIHRSMVDRGGHHFVLDDGSPHHSSTQAPLCVLGDGSTQPSRKIASFDMDRWCALSVEEPNTCIGQPKVVDKRPDRSCSDRQFVCSSVLFPIPEETSVIRPGASGQENHSGGDGSHRGAMRAYSAEGMLGYQPHTTGAFVNAAPAVHGMGLGALQLVERESMGQGLVLLGSEYEANINQKQYHRILKRREARMKLEAQYQIMPRREWLHDSRHKLTKNRLRGPGGRFLSKEEREARGQQQLVPSPSSRLCE